MTTLTEQQQKKSLDWLVHIELFAAILSGVLILTAWMTGITGWKPFLSPSMSSLF